MGQTHGRLLVEDRGPAERAAQIVLAGGKIAYCLAAAAIAAPLPVRRNRSLLRGIMHAGVVVGLFGVREIRQYGEISMGARGNAD